MDDRKLTQGSLFAAAPALFLERFEELRMELSDQQLIAEAINEKELPIDVVSEVLKPADITTTRRPYAPTKSERARAALVGMRLS